MTRVLASEDCGSYLSPECINLLADIKEEYITPVGFIDLSNKSLKFMHQKFPSTSAPLQVSYNEANGFLVLRLKDLAYFRLMLKLVRGMIVQTRGENISEIFSLKRKTVSCGYRCAVPSLCCIFLRCIDDPLLLNLSLNICLSHILLQLSFLHLYLHLSLLHIFYIILIVLQNLWQEGFT